MERETLTDRDETPNRDETTDPWGRRVVLKESAWEHIVERRSRLASFEQEILATVSRPDVITPDSRPNRWRYWQLGIGPSRWMFVVVGWSTRPAQIVTALSRREDPI